MRRDEIFPLITFLTTLVFVLVAGALLAPRLIGRDLTLTELCVIALLLCGVALWRRARSARRQRQRLDQIRDSALW